jgi:hypothetical protein
MPRRLSLLPRLRQACRGDHRGQADAAPGSIPIGQGPSAAAVAPGALQSQDPRLVLNRLFLSGVLVADPQRDEGRDGEPVTLLLVAFPAPDAKETEQRLETASCEVEVPASVAGRYGKKLQAGDSIFITGRLSGGGGVIATEIHSGSSLGEGD